MLPSSLDANHPFFALTPLERDYRWCIEGPALLDVPWSPAQCSWLKSLGCEQPSLQNFNYHSPQLGRRFEQLWQHYFALHTPHHQANVIIQSPERTLGEIDLLIDDGKQHWHIELALKFFLQVNQGWYGPDPRDQLHSKIEQLQNKQLPFSSHPLTQRYLLQQGWSIQQQRAITRGMLFFHAHTPHSPLPPEVNPNLWRGLWCYRHEVQQCITEGLWHPLERAQWLSPNRFNHALSAQALLECLPEPLTRAQAVVKVCESRHGFCEQQRWLIMPNEWPSL